MAGELIVELKSVDRRAGGGGGGSAAGLPAAGRIVIPEAQVREMLARGPGWVSHTQILEAPSLELAGPGSLSRSPGRLGSIRAGASVQSGAIGADPRLASLRSTGTGAAPRVASVRSVAPVTSGLAPPPVEIMLRFRVSTRVDRPRPQLVRLFSAADVLAIEEQVRWSLGPASD